MIYLATWLSEDNWTSKVVLREENNADSICHTQINRKKQTILEFGVSTFLILISSAVQRYFIIDSLSSHAFDENATYTSKWSYDEKANGGELQSICKP